ncbi:hypothetical protein AVEN_260888-1 [Araneus ventricosus]|uniref:Uncharacterized protein n=1 Tax=Araneus ventricosus TaxID=182803 RepID=A0A4Y2HDS2_ARAVE|nr:hypothetical protein AVEN_260888-1 [Araneus ventricosus]
MEKNCHAQNAKVDVIRSDEDTTAESSLKEHQARMFGGRGSNTVQFFHLSKVTAVLSSVCFAINSSSWTVPAKWRLHFQFDEQRWSLFEKQSSDLRRIFQVQRNEKFYQELKSSQLHSRRRGKTNRRFQPTDNQR